LGRISIEKLSSYRPWWNLERYQRVPEASKRRENAWNVARILESIKYVQKIIVRRIKMEEKFGHKASMTSQRKNENKSDRCS
tara:strand:+ start:229 stop:474 length:246 start_codon:yes stop_codon:yes gene_type:complete